MVEGKTEAEVAVELDYAVRSRGAQAMSFCSIIATGEHSSFPHHTPTNKVISEGDVVLCDFGAVYQGYCSDLTRTFPIGSVSEDLMQVYEAVLEAQKEAIRAIKEVGGYYDKIAEIRTVLGAPEATKRKPREKKLTATKVGRFQVMGLLQAARYYLLTGDLQKAKSFGLNRAIFYAWAKHYKAKAPRKRRGVYYGVEHVEEKETG